jgi:hypothetical protein
MVMSGEINCGERGVNWSLDVTETHGNMRLHRGKVISDRFVHWGIFTQLRRLGVVGRRLNHRLGDWEDFADGGALGGRRGLRELLPGRVERQRERGAPAAYEDEELRGRSRTIMWLRVTDPGNVGPGLQIPNHHAIA